MVEESFAEVSILDTKLPPRIQLDLIYDRMDQETYPLVLSKKVVNLLFLLSHSVPIAPCIHIGSQVVNILKVFEDALWNDRAATVVKPRHVFVQEKSNRSNGRNTDLSEWQREARSVESVGVNYVFVVAGL
jgi:hypothetical protein